jgi:hypothetical protein
MYHDRYGTVQTGLLHGGTFPLLLTVSKSLRKWETEQRPLAGYACWT